LDAEATHGHPGRRARHVGLRKRFAWRVAGVRRQSNVAVGWPEAITGAFPAANQSNRGAAALADRGRPAFLPPDFVFRAFAMRRDRGGKKGAAHWSNS
jgi:hypothetical protein